jgi:hypothetical protein
MPKCLTAIVRQAGFCQGTGVEPNDRMATYGRELSKAVVTIIRS